MKILGIIPARGGSKGVPGKNIKLLNGLPLLHYTARAALTAHGLHQVILSSDDPDIIASAKAANLEVPFVRPSHLAQDDTPTVPVVLHALNYFSDLGQHFDAVCLLQTTSPMRPEGFIDAAIQKFIESGADSLVTVVDVPYEFNPHWVFEPNEQGFLNIATGEKQIIPRRQMLPPALIRDGSIYLVKTSVLINYQSFFGEKIAYLKSNPHFYLNIDTFKDWLLAEEKIKLLYPYDSISTH